MGSDEQSAIRWTCDDKCLLRIFARSVVTIKLILAEANC